jgi:hypothetical protein
MRAASPVPTRNGCRSLDGEAEVLPVHTYRSGAEASDEAATLCQLRARWSHQRAVAAVGPRPDVPDGEELAKCVGLARSSPQYSAPKQ